jgi:hypothetical protein
MVLLPVLELKKSLKLNLQKKLNKVNQRFHLIRVSFSKTELQLTMPRTEYANSIIPQKVLINHQEKMLMLLLLNQVSHGLLNGNSKMNSHKVLGAMSESIFLQNILEVF